MTLSPPASDAKTILASVLGKDWAAIVGQQTAPLDTRPVVERASAKMASLLALDRNPNRAELAASEVAQHRIDLLYPLEFADLIPGIIELVTPEAYRARGKSDNWLQLSAYPKNIIDDWASIRDATEKASAEVFASDAFVALWAHLEVCLPEDVFEASPQAHAMASALWYAYWGMLNLNQTALWRSMCKAFDSTIDWVLPDLA